MLSEYIFYSLNVSGVVDIAATARFPDDTSAMRHASDFNHPHRVQVFAGKRIVGTVPGAINGNAPRRVHRD